MKYFLLFYFDGEHEILSKKQKELIQKKYTGKKKKKTVLQQSIIFARIQ